MLRQSAISGFKSAKIHGLVTEKPAMFLNSAQLQAEKTRDAVVAGYRRGPYVSNDELLNPPNSHFVWHQGLWGLKASIRIRTALALEFVVMSLNRL